MHEFTIVTIMYYLACELRSAGLEGETRGKSAPSSKGWVLSSHIAMCFSCYRESIRKAADKVHRERFV